MPVLFVGHGSPMNAIEDNVYRRSWQQLGSQFGTRYPMPQLILCISAHWLTDGWWLTGQERPPTIHDFGGFPAELFAQQYPAPGAPAVAAAIGAAMRNPPIGVDAQAWGLDHGAWSVLKPMFPAADIPVVQLSMDFNQPATAHLALGRQLRPLRDRGVLIVGSGNIVHNLRTMRREAASDQAYEWAVAFDAQVQEWLDRRDLAALAEFQQLGAIARLAQPSWEHYLPLLYAAGASEDGDTMQVFNASFQAASISMRSLLWAA
ncbi:4,5-DOPA dioxygenase extradiol [Ramlibacter sp. AN1015]|uniref:4,5-DOPA-extradiol-dioxygenase n=1 Tax=Ramlibacter sp. AN1015 TaxID=3133428 RepID=UPI0030BE967C